jgi:hypothetical protein
VVLDLENLVLEETSQGNSTMGRQHSTGELAAAYNAGALRGRELGTAVAQSMHRSAARQGGSPVQRSSAELLT